MTKSELVEQLSTSDAGLNKKEAELVVNTIFDSIGDALVSGDRVEIRGFGSFSIRERDAREARNPKSGEVVKLFVVKKDPSLTDEELRSFCKEKLGGYKVPKFIEFRDELPKYNVGKILRKDLRE